MFYENEQATTLRMALEAGEYTTISMLTGPEGGLEEKEVAQAMEAEKLAFLTDIEGVYKDPADKDSLISILTLKDAEELIHDGYIGGGMLPKLKNCIDAVRSGVSRVHILDGRIAHCILLEIFTKKGIGTAFVSDEQN